MYLFHARGNSCNRRTLRVGFITFVKIDTGREIVSRRLDRTDRGRFPRDTQFAFPEICAIARTAPILYNNYWIPSTLSAKRDRRNRRQTHGGNAGDIQTPCVREPAHIESLVGAVVRRPALFPSPAIISTTFRHTRKSPRTRRRRPTR